MKKFQKKKLMLFSASEQVINSFVTFNLQKHELIQTTIRLGITLIILNIYSLN